VTSGKKAFLSPSDAAKAMELTVNDEKIDVYASN
jgi:hypothetical protein